MIRILQVFANLSRGGAETMIMNYYRVLDRNRVQFDFVSHFKSGTYEEEILEKGAKIFRIPKFRGYNIMLYMNAWDKFFKSHPEYNIVHVHCFNVAGPILYIAKKNGVKTRIVHSHTSGVKYPFLTSVLIDIFNKIAIKTATHLFACGKKAGEFLFKDKDFTILKNAIDTNSFIFTKEERGIVRDSLNIKENDFIIGHVGRFCDAKNHKFVIEIFDEIHKLNDKSKLLLVGDGVLMSEIKALVKSKNLEKLVIFTGVRTDIPKMMMAMDVFLFPSIYEGLPVSVVEAQASGLKVFISDKITDEVIVSQLVEVMSLDIPSSKWAKKILNYSDGYARKSAYESIISAGYDVKENVKMLESFYISNN